MALEKVAGRTGGKGRGGSHLKGPEPDGRKKKKKAPVRLMADEILANLGRLTGRDHWNEGVGLCQYSALWEHGSETLRPCVCD